MTGGFTFGTTQTGGSGFSLGSANTNTTQNASFTLGTATSQSKPGSLTFGQQPGTSSFSFGTPQQQTTTSGFALGQTSTSGTQNLSFNLNTAQQTSQSNILGSSLGQQPAAQTTASGTGFTLGGTTTQNTSIQIAKPTTTLSSGFSLSQPSGAGGLTLGSSTAIPTTTSSPAVSFNLGGTSAANASLTQGVFTATSGGGLTLGQAAATSGGLTIGAVKPLATTGGFSLGSSLGSSTATVKPTLTLGATSTSVSNTGGLGGTATATTAGPTTGLFGALSTAASTSQPSSLFSSSTASLTTGLGGVDPKTTSSGIGVSGVTSKPGDSKTVKETPILNEIQATVNDFKTYVKNQKTVRENIARMSSTPLFKVQEEVTNLRQLLSVVSNGLQRNSIAIEKLKQESAEELKHAEIAHRTKETPLGLQYEHTAPTEYFQHLANGFESQMIFFRQQIEEMENYLNSLNLGVTLTPQEVSQILTKLHETFIALAGQLRIVHDAVQVQKDHYLNYRRIFLADNTDVFEKRRKAKQMTSSSTAITVGPTPFTTPSSAALVAIASSLNRNQPATGLGLNTGGFGSSQLSGFGTAGPTTSTGGLLGGATSGFGFGLSTGFGQKPATTTQSGFGTNFNLGTSTSVATVQPLGSTTAGLFGVGSTQPASAQPAGTGGFGLGSTTAFGAQNTSGQTSFQLQNPPPGSKRGKKA